jgi:Na+-translocating ferredoxin:NAD+ oxidoreductase subunit D
MILNQTKIGLAPQVHLSRSTANRMWLIAGCAFAPILQSSLSDGFSSLFIAVVAVSAALAAELALDAGAGRFSLGDGSAVASALVLTLLLPNRINPLIAAVAAVFAIIVVKHSFGGLGSNWLNPAVGAWLFARVSWPTSFTEALNSSPLVLLESSVSKGLSDPSGSPLAVLKIAGYKPSVLDGSFTDQLNSSLMFLGVELPGGYMDFFGHTDPGIIADRGLAALLLTTIVLAASRSTKAFIPAIFLAVFAGLVRLGGGVPYGGSLGGGDMLFSLLTGGTVLAAFLLTADPATGAKSNLGAVCTAALSGSLAFAIRFPGAEPYGAAIAVAAVDAVVPIIRRVERSALYMDWRAS